MQSQEKESDKIQGVKAHLYFLQFDTLLRRRVQVRFFLSGFHLDA